jgi:hypothetical protein
MSKRRFGIVIAAFSLIWALPDLAAQVNAGPDAAEQRGGLSGRRRGAAERSAMTVVPAARLVQKIALAGVRRLVPQQYATIQAAINASTDGDTLLVSEGRYKENIRYRGKAITVASLYLIDGDTTHIEKTIIDGSTPAFPDSGSVVYFVNGEDTTSVLCGLSVTGGTGTSFNFGGMVNRGGGGVYSESGGARLVRNIITRNTAIGPAAAGGGVAFESLGSTVPFVILERNTITDNLARGQSDTGWAYSGGVDLWNTSGRIVGNIFERDSALSAGTGEAGGLALYSDDGTNPGVVGHIQGNLFRSNVVQGVDGGAWAGGLLISWTGEVRIIENMFEGNGASAGGWGHGGALDIDDGEDDQDILGLGRKFVLRNRFLNNHLHGALGAEGGAIGLGNTRATISGNEFTNNIVTSPGYGAGGAIRSWISGFSLENNIITGNSAPKGGGIEVASPPRQGNEQIAINNTICGNQSPTGGGLLIAGGAKVITMNTIFWANSPSQIINNNSTVTAEYCDIQGGWSGVGNIDADPQFAGATYMLSSNSPCLGHGRDSLQIGGVWQRAPRSDFYGASRPNPVGSNPDIGACESPLATGVEEQGGIAPAAYALEQNYPNPFNPATVVSYQLPVASDVQLKVYDLLGRELVVLVDERKNPGHYGVRWDASGFPSGVYICRMTSGSFSVSRKMLLTK